MDWDNLEWYGLEMTEIPSAIENLDSEHVQPL